MASDNASETFSGLKRIHGLMPYFMLKTALKISNPISMIRSEFFFIVFLPQLPFVDFLSQLYWIFSSPSHLEGGVYFNGM